MILFLLLVSLLYLSQNDPTSINPPYEFDVGVVPANTIVYPKIVFSNDSGQPIYLGQIESTCGCLSILPQQELIGIGEDLSLSIEMKTGIGWGIDQEVLLRFKDPPDKFVSIHIRGAVENAPWYVVQGGEKVEAKWCDPVNVDILLFSNLIGRQVKFVDVTTVPGKLHARVVNLEPEVNDYSQMLTLSAKPGIFPIGRSRIVASISTTDLLVPEFQIPIVVRVLGPLVLGVQEVHLGLISPSENTLFEIPFRYFGKEKLELEIVSLPVGANLARYEGLGSGNGKIIVSYEAPGYPAMINSRVVLKTNIVDQRIVEIPIDAIIAKH